MHPWIHRVTGIRGRPEAVHDSLDTSGSSPCVSPLEDGRHESGTQRRLTGALFLRALTEPEGSRSNAQNAQVAHSDRQTSEPAKPMIFQMRRRRVG